MKNLSLFSLLFLIVNGCAVCYECTRQRVCAECTRDDDSRSICSDDFIYYEDFEKSKKDMEEKNFECFDKGAGKEIELIRSKGFMNHISAISDKEDMEDDEGFNCQKMNKKYCN